MNESLPDRMFLLSYDVDKGKLDAASVLVRGSLLRAAAVVELVERGLLREGGGKAERTPAAAPEDAFLAHVLDAVREDRPRRWTTLIDTGFQHAEGAVRDRLAAAGVITAERRRALGLFPVHDITATAPGQVRELQARVRDVVLGGRPPTAHEPQDVVLAAFALEGDVRTAFTGKERRAHRDAAKAVAAHVDERLPHLRKALTLSIAARRSAATA
ncbi:GOLPH3/VPS74 family protein [Saccharopolyspora gregorii]|uniref:GPP34 family phosphoprotein n=1 Tax=Saccharopolyspora gregorii TaxID=33914 RepID=A0ABP6S1C0_9PSEU|nr:GPP34 family phosphoprotein [Saccharopolyspora gregorii]